MIKGAEPLLLRLKATGVAGAHQAQGISSAQITQCLSLPNFKICALMLAAPTS